MVNKSKVSLPSVPAQAMRAHWRWAFAYRDSELSQYRSIHILHQRMNDGLRMDMDVNLFGRQIKEPTRLNEFQPLFIKLAESTEILRPISQRGCLQT